MFFCRIRKIKANNVSDSVVDLGQLVSGEVTEYKLPLIFSEEASEYDLLEREGFLYMLSDSTYVRRRSNVKKMMGYLIQSDEYDFTEFIDIIEL